MRQLIVLIMSVGPFLKNGSAKYLERIGGKDRSYIVMPKQFANNYAGEYTSRGFKVYVYDEGCYINKEMEYFGFRPCNCGGIGRQGIAEAVDALENDDNICLQIDDDTQAFCIRQRRVSKGAVRWVSKVITEFSSLERLINAYQDFYEGTGIKIHSKTGCTPITAEKLFFSNRKAYNNFIMSRKDDWRYKGFKYLCSDDVIYNYTMNLAALTPMLSVCFSDIFFTQNQGDREDGNAVLYNKDCSWKKSFSLRMFNPLLSDQHINKEENRILFRETLKYSKIYPPIMLTDKNGEITHKLCIR